MTKKFCDICGEPAIECDPNGRLVTEVGLPYTATKTYSGGCVDGNWQCKISTSFGFTMEDSSDGRKYSDLCEKHRASLLHELWLKYQVPEVPK